MKQLKRLSAIVLVALFAFGITSCDKKKDYSEQLVGNWYEEVNNGLFSLTLKSDMVAVELKYDANGTSIKRGTYSSDGNELTLTFDGTSNTYKFEFSDNKLIIEYPDVKHTLLKLREDIDLVGNWTVNPAPAKTFASIKPLKDELLIPGGTIVDGHEVPFSMPTANFTGQFVQYAIQQYLQDISFTENEMLYKVISRESETPINMKKAYTTENMSIIFSGKVMNFDFTTKMIAAQSPSADETTFVMDKENACSMFLGFAQLMGGSNLASQQLTQEQYDMFKEEFNKTFEKFAIMITINRVN